MAGPFEFEALLESGVAAPDLPGFGMRVKPEVWKHPKAIVRTSVA